VGSHNEFGFRLSAGADAGLGTGNKGFYEGLGVGIWIGYNHDKKEIGFTIFGERDGWVSAIPGVGLAEVRAKVLFTAKANDGEAPKVVEKKRLLFLALAAIQDDPKAVEAGLKVGVGPFIVHPVYQELTNTIFNVIGGTASPKTTGIFRITGAAGAVVGGILRSPYDFYKLVTTGKWGGPRKLSSVVERTKTDDKPPFSASIGVCYRDGFRRLSGKD
jgi:hypothetical protein